MKNRFIILIDFSEYSKTLLEYAYDCSLHYPAELLVVHQTLATTVATTKEVISEYDNAEAMRKLKELVAKSLPLTTLVSYSVSEINLSILLNKLLQEPYNNFIFMGPKSTGFIEGTFMGKTALQIFNSSNHLILIVPKEVQKFSCEKIYVAVTKEFSLNLVALQQYLLFFDNEKPMINFFYLSKSKEETSNIEEKLKELEKQFSQNWKVSTAIYQGSNTFDTLKKIINGQVLIVQKDSQLLKEELFRKFLINDLVYHGQTPIIILP